MNENVVNNDYLDRKISKTEGHIIFTEKDFIEFKMLSNKQSVEKILIQRAVKSTLQAFSDERLFDNYDTADEVLKDCLFVEKRRCGLDPKPFQYMMMTFENFNHQYNLKNKTTSNI